METFINNLPKCELHVHIEGTLEPELMFKCAKRNHIELPYDSVAEIKSAYQFDNLQSFLDLYYQGMNVLTTEQDYYDLAYAYFEQAKLNHIVHTEVFFDPQAHTERGIPFEVFMPGFLKASKDAQQKLGISCYWIMSFLKHLSEQSAFATLDAAQPYLKHIHGVGLDSTELGNPAKKFKRVFAKAHDLGLKCVSHSGEEGPPIMIWETLEHLNVARIDHGVRSAEDAKLVEHLKAKQIPLTVCPLSNIKLKVFQNLNQHSFDKLLKNGLLLTINSDDPAYFGGYINQNYLAIQNTFNYDKATLKQLAKNSFIASFLPETDKQKWCNQVDSY